MVVILLKVTIIYLNAIKAILIKIVKYRIIDQKYYNFKQILPKLLDALVKTILIGAVFINYFN